MEIQSRVKIREWGNSLGIVLPREIVLTKELKPNMEVMISIRKKENLEEFFGRGNRKIKNVQKEKDEVRKSWRMN